MTLSHLCPSTGDGAARCPKPTLRMRRRRRRPTTVTMPANANAESVIVKNAYGWSSSRVASCYGARGEYESVYGRRKRWGIVEQPHVLMKHK